MNIQDKVALIVGGGQGLGEATARYLAELGAKVIVVDKSADNAQRVASVTKGEGIACDISSESDVEKVFNRIASVPLSIVVNCAGIAPAKRMVGKEGPAPLSGFEEVIRINLIGSYNIMRLSAAMMMKLNVPETQERGVIINTASVAAFDGQLGQTAYSASKGGIVSLTLPAARELARYNIRVMTIAPGIMDTSMMQNMPENVRTSLLNQTVYPKRFGQPQEFAELVAHIVTNSMLNGTVIRLDGALRMSS
ncbi:MAG: SDR family NAD(P)-dependent oxidoreductase [Candidatus Berkiella sp.]